MKHIKKFNEGIVQWKQEDLDKAFDILSDYLEEASKIIGEEDLDPEGAIMLLDEIGTEESVELSNNIDRVLDLIAEFDVEREIEHSKLN